MSGEMLKTLGVGALAGAVAGGIVWVVVVQQVDAQVTRTIQREVPPQLRTALDQKLASFGLTTAMASNIRALMNTLSATGAFNGTVAR